MRKRFQRPLWAFILILAALLTGCGQNAPAQPDATPPVGVYGQPPLAESGWAEKYAAFAADNYAALSDGCYGGVAGAGFIDLDLDGTPELLLFDSGASASMGVSLFDLRDGQVTCVSTRSAALGQAFGGGDWGELTIDALYFEDFRLLRDADGRRWFEIVSKNGADDFHYTHRIRFTGRDGLLTLSSVSYRRVDTDPVSGEERGIQCSVAGQAADEAAWQAAENAAATAQDVGYEAAGAFIWADRRFGYDYDGFLAMLSAAVNAYISVV